MDSTCGLTWGVNLRHRSRHEAYARMDRAIKQRLTQVCQKSQIGGYFGPKINLSTDISS
ncbi:hypothetical protein TRIP_B180002 [uncultured Desulfatiglans sp.]|uniref:Uncharacterized protein n=1 Tax=Uncultured Desulfatiglans sp. TaxID=1748965 RepID=A0A653A192_UNCDX|nr:hypothetical protein TRIP_B180002 [uncultured Desulfatiglans sp.]